MNWNNLVRQAHRWICMAFTAAVIFIGIAILRGEFTAAMGLLAVVPLAFLLLTGLYLFVLPYVTRWRNGRRAE